MPVEIAQEGQAPSEPKKKNKFSPSIQAWMDGPKDKDGNAANVSAPPSATGTGGASATKPPKAWTMGAQAKQIGKTSEEIQGHFIKMSVFKQIVSQELAKVAAIRASKGEK